MDGILCAGMVSGYDWRRQTGRVQLMAFFGDDRQTRSAWAFVQGWRVRRMLLAGIALIGGCANYHTSGPEAWWHKAIGGKIAQQRPPPPGADDPWPNLATVPPRPPPVNAAEWNQRTAGLITDRIKADQAAALAPIPPAAAASSSAVGPGQRQNPGPRNSPAQAGSQSSTSQSPTSQNGGAHSSGAQAEPGASAELSAVSPPAAPSPGRQPRNPRPPPVPAGASPVPPAPFNQPSATSSPPGGVAVVSNASRAEAERVANEQLPTLPADAPARPDFAPPPPPPLVPPTVTPPSAEAPRGTAIDFDQGSDTLDGPALADVKIIASLRGDRGIAVTGYGGATSPDPVAQSAALSLGLSRAQALATALVAQGVPYAMLRLNAESAGRGAALRLLP